MGKIHTGVKRRKGLTTSSKHYFYFHPMGKKRRAKTFRTEEAAHAWASSKGLNEGQYSLNAVKKGKRLQVVIKKDKTTNKNSL